MALYMIWYRTAAGKLTTTKIKAATKSAAIRQFKKTVRDTPPFRVLKLKKKSELGKCGKSKEAGEMSGKKRKSKKRKAHRMSGKDKAVSILSGRKKHRKGKKRAAHRMSGKNRSLVLIPKGDKAKAEAMKDKLKNNIIIYGRKTKKGGSTMPKMKKGDIAQTLINGLTGAGAGIAGGIAGNYIPLPENIKPFLTIALGLAIPMLPVGSREIKQAASVGLIAIGTYIALKKFFPQLPIMAGEETPELTETDIQQLGLDDDDVDTMGDVVDVSGDVLSLQGSDFITSADS